MQRKKICVLGSLNVDLTLTVQHFNVPGETVIAKDFQTYLGGKGGNQAVAAARLGAEVYMIGCVGDDANGEMYIRALEKEGVNTQYITRTSDAPTGVALIEVDESGENRIVVAPGANMLLSCDQVSAASDLLLSCDVLLLQLETPIESSTHAAAIVRRGGGKVILDPAPARPVPDALLFLSSYVTPNESELVVISGKEPKDEQELREACASLLERGAGCVINKRGAKGATVVSPSGAMDIAGFKVDAVDTTAAGDTFNAGFAVGLTMDMGNQDAVLLANAAAALSTTGAGAQGAMPDLYTACTLVESLT